MGKPKLKEASKPKENRVLSGRITKKSGTTVVPLNDEATKVTTTRNVFRRSTIYTHSKAKKAEEISNAGEASANQEEAKTTDPKAGPSGTGNANRNPSRKRLASQDSQALRAAPAKKGRPSPEENAPTKRTRGQSTKDKNPPKAENSPKVKNTRSKKAVKLVSTVTESPLKRTRGQTGKQAPKPSVKATKTKTTKKAAPKDAIEEFPEAGPSKLPPVSKRVRSMPAQESEEDSDKENQVQTTVAEIHAPPVIKKKQPVYKILDAKPSAAVPKDKLIVMDEKPEEEDEFDFPLSQNGSGVAQPKKKMRKKVSKPVKTKSPRGLKIWSPKNVRKALRKKETAAEVRAAKLKDIPTHIREKIREKIVRKSFGASTSTPIRTETVTSGQMQIHEQMSPIMDVSSCHEEEEKEEEEVEVSAEEAPVQPWRVDDSLKLPTTSRTFYSERDQLPTYSSDNTSFTKATSTKPQSPEEVSSASSSNLHISRYFGFDESASDAEEERSPEVAQKHKESDLQREQERVKKLKEKVIPTQSMPTRSQPSRARRPAQQLTLEEVMPSTSKPQPSEVGYVEDSEEEHPWKDSRGVKFYKHRRHREKEVLESSADEESEHEEEGELDEPMPVADEEKKAKKEKKKASKPKVSKKDLEREKELEEFYKSFNEECEEVDKVKLIIEKESPKK